MTYAPHLLGRRPSTPDGRNWPLAPFLAGAPTVLDAELAAVLAQHHTNAFKAWARDITAAVQGTRPAPTPGPTPTPTPAPSGAVVWADAEQLDQGSSPHCVGAGWAQFLNTRGSENVDDHLTNADAHAIYYECKIIDGEPGLENGSSVHSGARAIKARGRINGYAWAASLDEIKQWILARGPICVGTDWYDGMFTPDVHGIIHPTGNIAGGHCFVLDGFDPATNLLRIQNSWGTSWGIDGYAFIDAAEFEMVAATDGEACAAVEVAALARPYSSQTTTYVGDASFLFNPIA